MKRYAPCFDYGQIYSTFLEVYVILFFPPDAYNEATINNEREGAN